MEIEKFYELWKKHFAGVIQEKDLKFVRQLTEIGKDIPQLQSMELGGNGYECPCGGDDHLAIRVWIHEGLSKSLSWVLTCTENFNLQWLIDRPPVADIIRKEEERYCEILRNAGPRNKRIVEKITKKKGKNKETLLYLWDTHGIDAETVKEIWGEE